MTDDKAFHLDRAEQEIARAERTSSRIKRKFHLELARLHIDATSRSNGDRVDIVEI